MQFLIVDRCRNHLANLLSSWTSSKVRILALEFLRSLSAFHTCNYFLVLAAISIFPVASRCCTYLPKLFSTYTLYHRYVVRILTVLFTVSEILVFPVSAAISDCRLLLESPRYTSCEFAMVECRRFVVGMLMVHVIVSEISVLPVSCLPSWIFDTR